jgi:hypothetical protein
LHADPDKELITRKCPYHLNPNGDRFARIFAGDEIEEGRKNELRNAFSFVMSVAIQLTQQDCYKANFVSVLKRILVWVHGNQEELLAAV